MIAGHFEHRTVLVYNKWRRCQSPRNRSLRSRFRGVPLSQTRRQTRPVLFHFRPRIEDTEAKNKKGGGTRRRGWAVALNRLRRAHFPSAVIGYSFLPYVCLLVAFPHLFNNLGAYLSHIFPIVIAGEMVGQYVLVFVLVVGANDIFVQYIRYKVLG